MVMTRPASPERLGPGDRTVLATDRGAPPMQIAALLQIEQPDLPAVAEITGLLGERVPRVPRLRQCLHRARLGRGPTWVEDRGFDLDRHLLLVPGMAPGDHHRALETVMDAACQPLPRDRPLWRVLIMSDDQDRVGFLGLVVHHVLADGVAGLAALTALTDQGTPSDVVTASGRDHTLPSAVAATADRRPGRWAAGLSELGLLGGGVPHLAPRISLVRPTGPSRRAAVVRMPLGEATALAHAVNGTVNDVLLAMITGALLRVLRDRGECPARLVVSVPIAGPGGPSGADGSAEPWAAAGNHTGVRPVTVPAIVNDAARLRYLARLRESRRGLVRASSSVPLGCAFRALARLGLFGWFVDHQRLVHTFASNLRGPERSLSLGRHRIAHVTALSVSPGNIGVSFTALSYAGELALTVVSDPAICDPEPVADATCRVVRSLGCRSSHSV